MLDTVSYVGDETDMPVCILMTVLSPLLQVGTVMDVTTQANSSLFQIEFSVA